MNEELPASYISPVLSGIANEPSGPYDLNGVVPGSPAWHIIGFDCL